MTEQPTWWQKARYEGKKHPCPICEARGEIPSTLLAVYPNLKHPWMICYHCQGSGDESVAIRRNQQDRRTIA